MSHSQSDSADRRYVDVPAVSWNLLRVCAAAFFAVLCAGAGVARSAEPLIRTGGTESAVELVSLAQDWKLEVRAADRSESLALHEWFAWGAYRPQATGHHILLRDGSQIVAPVLAISQSWVMVDSDLWGQLKIPRERVLAVVLTPPLPWKARDELWAQLLQQPAERDRIVLANGDDVSGVLELPARLPEPIPFFLSALRLKMDPLGETVRLSAKQIQAVRFAGPAVRSSPSGVVATDDGTRCQVTEALVDETSIRLKLVCGWTLAAPAGDVRSRIAYLRSPPQHWQPLDAGEPLDQTHIPMLQRRISPRLGRSAAGTHLRVAGVEYGHGIGVFGRSRVVYQVPAGATRLVVRVGIDDRAGRSGSVVFRVYTSDGEGAWRLAAESPRMAGGMAPRRLAVELERQTRVALITDVADHGEVLDYANWLDARWEKGRASR